MCDKKGSPLRASLVSFVVNAAGGVDYMAVNSAVANSACDL